MGELKKTRLLLAIGRTPRVIASSVVTLALTVAQFNMFKNRFELNSAMAQAVKSMEEISQDAKDAVDLVKNLSATGKDKYQKALSTTLTRNGSDPDFATSLKTLYKNDEDFRNAIKKFVTSPNSSDMVATLNEFASEVKKTAEDFNVQQNVNVALYSLKDFCSTGDPRFKKKYDNTLAANTSDNFRDKLVDSIGQDEQLGELIDNYHKKSGNENANISDIMTAIAEIQKTAHDITKFAKKKDNYIASYGTDFLVSALKFYSRTDGDNFDLLDLGEKRRVGIKKGTDISLGVMELVKKGPLPTDYYAKRQIGDLGIASGAVIAATPTLWKSVGDQVRRNLEDSYYDPNVRAVFDRIFGSEEGYKAFLNQTDKEGYIRGLITQVIPFGGVQQNQTGATASGAPQTEQSVTFSQTSVVTLPNMIPNKIMAAYNKVSFSMNEIYNIVVSSPALSEFDRMGFRTMVATLYNADQRTHDLVQAFLLAAYVPIAEAQSTGKKLSQTIQERHLGNQLRFMEGVWGGSLAGQYGILNGPGTPYSWYTKYLDVVFTNISLGAVLVGSADAPVRATTGKAFAVGFIAFSAGLLEYGVEKPIDKLSMLSLKSLEGTKGAEYIVAPVMAIIGVAAYAGANVISAVNVLSPWRDYMLQAAQIGTNISDKLESATQSGGGVRLFNPMVISVPYGIVAALGSNKPGVRGQQQPTLGVGQGITTGTTSTGVAPIPGSELATSGTSLYQQKLDSVNERLAALDAQTDALQAQINNPSATASRRQTLQNQLDALTKSQQKQRDKFATDQADLGVAISKENADKRLSFYPNELRTTPPSAGTQMPGLGAGAQEAITPNVFNLFKESLKLVTESKEGNAYNTADQVYAGLLAGQSIVYSIRSNPNQEATISFWEKFPIVSLFVKGHHIDTDIFSEFRKIAAEKGVTEVQNVFVLIKKINKDYPSRYTLNEMMEIYENKGLDGLTEAYKKSRCDFFNNAV